MTGEGLTKELPSMYCISMSKMGFSCEFKTLKFFSKIDQNIKTGFKLTACLYGCVLLYFVIYVRNFHFEWTRNLEQHKSFFYFQELIASSLEKSCYCIMWLDLIVIYLSSRVLYRCTNLHKYDTCNNNKLLYCGSKEISPRADQNKRRREQDFVATTIK